MFEWEAAFRKSDRGEIMDRLPEESLKADTPKPKKPYVKPAFRYERVFETQALSCGKIGILPITCIGHTKTS